MPRSSACVDLFKAVENSDYQIKKRTEINDFNRLSTMALKGVAAHFCNQ